MMENEEAVQPLETEEAVRSAEPEMEEVDRAPEKSSSDTEKKILRAYVVLLSLVVLAGGGYVLFRHFHNQEEQEQEKVVGSSLVVITDDNREEFGKTAAQKVAEGMISVRMTTTWTFEDGNSAGNGYVANSKHNSYPLKITVTLASTGDTVLETEPIPVGMCVENFKLSKVLEKGSYQAIVAHSCVNDEGEIFNEVRTQITINVLN